MSYDKDVEVRLETINKNSQNLNFSMPLDYFWNNLSEDDLSEIAKQFVSGGFLTKVLKELINEPSLPSVMFGSTDQNYIEFKQTLIGLVDDLKESYVKDLEESEMRRWWQVSRSLDKIVKTICPDRNIHCVTQPHVDGFLIIDKDRNKDGQLYLNLLDWTGNISNEKTNGKDADNYFYEFRKELVNIIDRKNRYYEIMEDYRIKNLKLEGKIRELEKLTKHITLV